MKKILLSLLLLALAVSAKADDMTLLGVGNQKHASSSALVNFISSNSSTSAGLVFTYTNQNIGVADPSRIIVVGITSIGAVGITDIVTIGGILATQAPGAFQNESSGALSDIFYLAVPTGTTSNIVVNYSASQSNNGLFVYSVIGAGAAFSSATGNSTNSSVTTLSASRTVPSGGGTMGIVRTHNSANTVISGTNLGMDVTGLILGNSSQGGGHDNSHSGTTNFAFTWGTGTDAAMSIATFSP